MDSRAIAHRYKPDQKIPMSTLKYYPIIHPLQAKDKRR